MNKTNAPTLKTPAHLLCLLIIEYEMTDAHLVIDNPYV